MYCMCLRHTNVHIHIQILSCARVNYSGTCTNGKLQRRFLFVSDHNKQDNNVSLRVPTAAMYIRYGCPCTRCEGIYGESRFSSSHS